MAAGVIASVKIFLSSSLITVQNLVALCHQFFCLIMTASSSAYYEALKVSKNV